MIRYLTIVSLAIIAALAVTACSSGEVIKEVGVPGETVVVEREVIKAVEVPVEVLVEREVVKEVEVPVEVVVEKEVVREVEVPGETVVVESQGAAGPAGAAGEAGTGTQTGDGAMATLVRQQRIVVRTVGMSLVVSGIQNSMDDVAAVAYGMGGWTVSSERSSGFSGSIAVRVPAERLDEAIAQIRDIAVNVEAEVTTSKDVTAEYFDSQSRLRNLRAAETAMLNLLERAKDSRDALDIRNSLFEVQEAIEVLLGRLKLLEETSAFSLINVNMRVARVDLRVDAGPDRIVSIGQTARFKASFHSPDDSAAYQVEWDFGDRSEPIVDFFTAATTQPGTRVTASVTHVFDDYRDSPYFVDVRITGASESSPLFGQDTIKITVLDTEQMPVDAGENQTIAVGRSVRFRAFFEPPEGIDDFTYTWDFGDGTSPVSGNRAILTEDSSRMVTAVTNHVYGSAEESPYIVQIKMVATGEAGVVEGSDKAVVTVTELPALIVSAGENVTVEERVQAKLSGTFNRPAGVTNMRYRWGFGDGSAPEEGELGEEGTVIETEHEYIHQKFYVATLTVTGDSEVGLVEASSNVDVNVVEGKGWVVGGYDVRGNSRDAVRLLSVVFKGIVTGAIWVVILSPLWGGLIVLVFLLNRLSTRLRPRPTPPQPPSPKEATRED